MTDVTAEESATVDTPAAARTSTETGLDAVDEQLIDRLANRARAGGLQLAGEGGLVQALTKRLLESALEGEITDHLGYDRHDPAGRDGGNSRNGHRAKTVLTDVGPVEIDVPRDRDASFEPKIVAKRQRRLSGIDELVISLAAKGLTTGEVQAHLAEVYGAQVSRQTISTITDKVLESMAEWQNRPPGLPGDLHRRHPREDPTLTMIASMNTAMYTPSNGRAAQSCISATTVSVIREIVSFDTDAP
jgi:putative transposase